MRGTKADVLNRRDELLAYIINKEETTIEELAMVFSVSTLTIRRDIEELKNNDVVSVRNGFVRITDNRKFFFRDKSFYVERKRIQMRAAELIEDGDVIYINTSFTALGMLEFIQNTYCTVVTNNSHIFDLNLDNRIIPILTGGEIRQPRSSLSGEYTLEMLNRIRANKCFVGVDGISLDGTAFVRNGGALSCSVHHEAIINETMLKNCTGKRYITVLSNRFGRIDRFSCGTLDNVDGIITDSQANPLDVSELKSRGIEVLLV